MAKRWKRIPHLKQWHESSGMRYPETVPTTIKRERKPKTTARLTNVEWQKSPTKSQNSHREVYFSTPKCATLVFGKTSQ